MPLYSFDNVEPKIGERVFIAPSADVMGKVELADDSNIWFGCLLRGDENKIVVGKNSNVQDLTTLHVTEEFPCIIGDNVTLGHNVIAHACTIEDNCLIGMGAIVLDGAVIGKNSVVAAGSVVPPGKKYPPGSMIMGSPAVVRRPLREDELDQYGNHYKSYLVTKNDYLNEKKFKLIES